MIQFAYKRILKPILFRFDAERVHDAFIRIGEVSGSSRILRKVVHSMYGYKGRDVSRIVDGITYRVPILLAAGFDYNGRLVSILDAVGFGGEEVGSVTARPCGGNSPPRLRRMIRSRSLIVYKGLKNEGIDAVIKRIKRKRVARGFVVGISIAKTNDEKTVSIEAGIADYHYSLRRLVEEEVGDFYTINISCPTVGRGESFTEPGDLEKLLEVIDQVEHDRPVYLKLPISCPWAKYRRILKVADRHRVHGVVIGNLNKNYEDADFPEEAPKEYRGGLSGKPCRDISNTLIRRTRETYGDRFTIIGCGGISSPEEALEKFRAGADLLQLITGMIFEGPHLMKEIAATMASAEEERRSSTIRRAPDRADSWARSLRRRNRHQQLC